MSEPESMYWGNPEWHPPEPKLDPLTLLPDPQDGDPLLFEDKFAFSWVACQPWLAARGYKLYTQERRDGSLVWSIPPFTTPAPLPYATCVRGHPPTESAYIHSGPPKDKIAWAQDSANRDIILKMIRVNKDEYRIYKTLLHHSQFVDRNTNVGVLLPLAILDTPFSYAFVAMPRWGDLDQLTLMNTARDVLQYMRCTLEGLSLLHSCRIVHRDIAEFNSLIDCYSPDIPGEKMGPILDNHRRTIGAQYCIFDFNVSIQLPPDTPLRECLCPTDESTFAISYYAPGDVDLGESVFNPFALDVGSLGKLYMSWFSRAVTAVPMLAVLLERMTDHDISRRFTAEEALTFLDAVIAQLPDDVWNAPLSLDGFFSWDATPAMYWPWTPPGFAALWSHYRAGSRTWAERILWRVCSWDVGWQTVRHVRAILRI